MSPRVTRLVRLLILLLAGVLLMIVLERRLIFFPSGPLVARPADYGLRGEDVWITTADRVRLHGWWIAGAPRADPASAPSPRWRAEGGGGAPSAAAAPGTPGEGRVLVWYHGNAGNISHRLENARMIVERFGLDILLVGYRGYGRSGGAPDEAGLYLDGTAIYEEARRRGFTPDRIVLFGRSIGCAVAIDVAARHPAGGVILETPFLSVPALARVHYPFVPVWLIRTRFDNGAAIRRVRVPVLVIQAEADEIVPDGHARRLYELAPGPKRFYLIPGATHNDTFIVGGEGYWAAWRAFLAGL